MRIRISPGGLDFIKRQEGKRLEAYDDATGKRVLVGDAVKGKLTIGYGHTGTNVHTGQIITDAEAEQILLNDLAMVGMNVGNFLDRIPTQSQADAMISLAFNIGPEAFSRSTVLHLFNKGDVAGSANAFLLWNKTTISGKKTISPGLVKRRSEEMALFLSGMIEPDAPMPQSVAEPVPVHASPIAIGSAVQALGGGGAVLGLLQTAMGDWRSIAALSALLIVGGLAVTLWYRFRQRAEGRAG